MTAGGPYLAGPVDLSALADRSGVVEWGRLAALATDSDVVVGEVLDEELIVCRGLAGVAEEPDPHWTPYQWKLTPALRSVATRTVERLDAAHGVILYPEDAPGEVECSPLLGAVVHAFEHAVAQITWRFGPGEREAWAGAVLVLDDGTVLHDDLDIEAGQHVLVVRSLEREVIYVAGALDPDDRAGDGWPTAPDGSSAPMPDVRQLVATAITATTMQSGPAWRSASPERTVRAVATDDGLWLLEGDGTAEVAGVQWLTSAGVDQLARQLLSHRR